VPSLGEAYIEVHADTGPFDRELTASIEEALIKAEAAMRSRGRDAGNAFGEGVETAVKDHTKRIGDDLGDDLVKAAENAGRRAATAIGNAFEDIGIPNLPDILVNDKDLDRSRNRFRQWASDVSSSVSSTFRTISNGFEGLTSVLTQFTRVSVLANPGVLVSAFGILGGAILGLLQVLNPLVALVAALPGAFVGLGAEALVILAAFDGLSKSIKAAFAAKNLEELKKVTKGFDDSIGNFLRGVYSFGVLWRQIIDIVQKRFFLPFGDILDRVAKVLGSGKILSGIGQLAYALGRFAAALIDMFESPAFVSLVEDLFPAISRIVDRLAGPFLTLLNGLFNMMDASLPFLADLADLLGNLMSDFGSWLTTISKNGQLTDFFTKAIDTLKILGQILFDVTELVGVFLRTLNENETGNNFLRTISVVLEGLTRFFSSKLGQDAIKSMTAAAMGALVIIGALIIVITLAWQSMIYLFEGIVWFFNLIWKGIQLVGQGIDYVFHKVLEPLFRWGPELGQSIINAFSLINSFLSGTFAHISSVVTTATGNVVKTIRSLPDKITAALSGFGDLLKNTGKSLINGLIRGIEDSVPGLRGTLNWITSMIPNWKGPQDKDKRILQPAGMALMTGLRAGIADGAAGVFSDLRALTGMIGMTANANSFVFGPGAITQNFNGAQPTAIEAQALGSAVGSGIANTVNRQNMAASTRAI
jgi:phage-related protein